MNKAQIKAKQRRLGRKEVHDLQMQGAKYALNVYRKAVSIVMGLGDKRLDRIDKKFIELLEYDDVFQDRKKSGAK